MSLAILFYFLCVQHVSDINISIIRSLRLLCLITTLVVLFLVRCVLEIQCGLVGVVSVLQAASIQQNSRKLLMIDILISETCWAYKKWNKIGGDIKLVFYSSTIAMMHGLKNISVRDVKEFWNQAIHNFPCSFIEYSLGNYAISFILVPRKIWILSLVYIITF